MSDQRPWILRAIVCMVLWISATRLGVAAAPTTTRPLIDPLDSQRRLQDPTSTLEQRATAIVELTALGPAAKPAVPALCKLLARTDPGPDGMPMGQAVARLLGHIGPDA